MSRRRDRRELAAEILETISQGEKRQCRISGRIGINNILGKEILKRLADSGLVSCTEIGARFREYTITEKGTKFLRSFKIIGEVMSCL